MIEDLGIRPAQARQLLSRRAQGREHGRAAREVRVPRRRRRLRHGADRLTLPGFTSVSGARGTGSAANRTAAPRSATGVKANSIARRFLRRTAPSLGNSKRMTEHVDCVVIGAGVVGLAVARELALAGREVIVLEAAESIGTHTSSRNSEVIHAGLYYPKGSLKARLCIEGKHRLYAYCAERGVPHERIGKVVVAADESEIPAVESYVAKARANGVTDLEWLSADQLHELEPEVRCVAGFLSPSTGIIDSHALMLALQGDAENHAATVVFHSPVQGGAVSAAGDRAPRWRGRACHTRLLDSGELRRPLRTECSALDPRDPAGKHSAAVLRESALLHAVGPLTIPTPGLPGCNQRIPRRARHPRPRRPGALRPRRRAG